jgi:hypothetical protein
MPDANDVPITRSLEFDLVVLIDPEAFGDGIEGAVDRYVAMTRASPRPRPGPAHAGESEQRMIAGWN